MGCPLLPIVTLGVYHLVWCYMVNKEPKGLGEAKGYDLGQSPATSLLALFPGFLVIVLPLVSYWRGTKRVQGAARIAGREPVNGWICLVLYLVISIGFYAYLQSSLNKIWSRRQRGPGRLRVARPHLADPPRR
ncbi:MAG: DUF4234 domain-containing protein [Solirubrobacterales bacterium]